MEGRKPLVFIASSDRARSLVRNLTSLLSGDLKVIPWKIAFPAGEHFLASLLRELDRFDFGIYVFTHDLTAEAAGRGRRPRAHLAAQNVTLEAGMAIGRYGPQRSIIVQEVGVDLPSDLQGITVFRFEWHQDPKESEVEMASLAAKVQGHIERVGARGAEQGLRYLSLIKVAPGKQDDVTLSIHEMEREMASLRGPDPGVSLDKFGVTYGEWDDFVLFTSPGLSKATDFVRDLRRRRHGSITSVETRQLFPGALSLPPRYTGGWVHHLVFLSCTSHLVEDAHKGLCELAEKETDIARQGWQISDTGILFGQHDIFFIVSTKTLAAFDAFLHGTLKKRLELDWLRDNTTSFRIEYLAEVLKRARKRSAT